MKNTLIKKIVAIGLLVCSTVVYASPNLGAVKTLEPTYQAHISKHLKSNRRALVSSARKNVNFENIKYTHIDEKEFYQLAKEIE